MVRDFGTEVFESRSGLSRERAFLGISALLFIASAVVTIYWNEPMSGGMPMPGEWTMSMAWMRTPGQTWIDAGASFLEMWIVMMVVMMLLSIAPMLLNYRRSVHGTGETRLGGLTALVGAGYFFVWAVFGAVAYPIGVVLAAVEMRWSALARFTPIAIGVVLLLAGCFQLTTWKACQLGRCKDAPGYERSLSPDALSAVRHGLGLGVRCSLCCSGFMKALFVTDVMNFGAMATVTTAITVERFALRPEPAARLIGVIVIAAEALVITRPLGSA